MIDSEVLRTFDRRSAMFFGGGAVLTSLLVLRMLQLQVFNYSEYKRKAQNNSFRIQVNLAERGRILSRWGTPISRDIRIYRIYIVPEESTDLMALIEICSRELNLGKKRINKIWRTINRQRAFQPVLIAENTDWGTLAGLQTRNLAGLHIENGFARNYSLGVAGAQIFGYTGVPARITEKTNAARSPFYTTGISGLEYSFNDVLSGTAGQTVLITNAVGRITGVDESQEVAPIPGNDITTTIDDEVQKVMADALALNQSGCGVAMDANTGEILAMVSMPSFDANNFRGDDGDEYLNNLREDYAKPFMNKVIEGLYPPGSVFKIVVALAALEAGAITPNEKIFCPGYWEYGNHRYHCWEKEGHGWENLTDALKHSCDIYFYQVALRIGIDAIKHMAQKLGLGAKYMDGVLPRETIGILPDRNWKLQNKGENWVHGDTIISGIGQGFVLTNALQLAVMMARVVSNTGVSPVLLGETRDQRPETRSLGLSKKNIDSVCLGLAEVLRTDGTASGSAINVNGKKMGGKTGTSQVRNISAAERKSGVLTTEQLKWNQRNHGLFVGFAPLDKPKYVVSVIAEHAGGSGPAARVCARVMKELLK